MAGSTMVRVSDDTKRQLEELKQHPRETIDDVVRRLVESAREAVKV